MVPTRDEGTVVAKGDSLSQDRDRARKKEREAEASEAQSFTVKDEHSNFAVFQIRQSIMIFHLFSVN